MVLSQFIFGGVGVGCLFYVSYLVIVVCLSQVVDLELGYGFSKQRQSYKKQQTNTGSVQQKRWNELLNELFFILGSLVQLLASWNAVFQNWQNYNCNIFSVEDCLLGLPHKPLPSTVDYTYVIEFGWYLHMQTRYFTVGSLTQTQDLTAHHYVTIVLITASYKLGLQRIGVLTMAILNISTPFLHVAKFSNILDNKHPGMFSKILFGLFGVVFFMSRIVLFPLTVLKCAILDGFKFQQYRLYYFAFISLLGVLQVMQIIWMKKIVGILVRGSVSSDKKS
eukprot:TRINITY_DN10274_c0_g1_i1.p1 TRINITY_DN10274_c0_g1~~TRINITY_DN10274_c0_g1_i1.p1  ORF type:complete len:304 (+),score=3.84 TRINITY_DN10274_c0_g1_i1:78-914(+)